MVSDLQNLRTLRSQHKSSLSQAKKILNIKGGLYHGKRVLGRAGN